MPVSFWTFLIVCFISFIVAVDDHGEEWKGFKEKKGCPKLWKGLKIFSLWFVCVGSFAGTLVLGWESWQDQKKDAERELQYNIVTNQLTQANAKINILSNNLRQVVDTANDRTVTPQQQADMIESLKPISNSFKLNSICIKIGTASPEGMKYGERLQEVLQTCGFNVNLLGTFMLESASTGLEFDVKDSTNPPEFVKAITGAFDKENIPWFPNNLKTASTNSLIIWVWDKP